MLMSSCSVYITSDSVLHFFNLLVSLLNVINFSELVTIMFMSFSFIFRILHLMRPP